LAKRLVEQPYDLRLYFVHEQNVPEDLVRAFDGPGARHEHLGPGFRLVRVAPHDEPNTAIYKVTIWDVIMARDSNSIDSESTGQDLLLPGEREQPGSSRVGVSFLGLFGAIAVAALVGLGLSLAVAASRKKC
jgi:hypothetical protein